MFLVEASPKTYPPTYVPTDTIPSSASRYDRAKYYLATSTEFVVHSKMWRHEKPQPYVVRGVHGDRLLVQALVEAKLGYSGDVIEAIGSWHEVDAGNTTEGYRFKRHVLKPMLTLFKLTIKGHKTRQRIEVIAAQQAERSEKCGICPCCFADFVVVNPDEETRAKMVHHGYERPGHGSIVGDCFGVGYSPFEISCEGTKELRAMLQLRLASEVTYLTVTLPGLDEVNVEDGHKYINGHALPKYKLIKRGEPGFDRAIALKKHDTEMNIDGLTRKILSLNEKITNWKPAMWPRATKKGSK